MLSASDSFIFSFLILIHCFIALSEEFSKCLMKSSGYWRHICIRKFSTFSLLRMICFVLNILLSDSGKSPSIASFCSAWMSFFKYCVHAQSHSTLCNPMDCSLLGFSVHGIFQARILEWIAIFYTILNTD